MPPLLHTKQPCIASSYFVNVAAVTRRYMSLRKPQSNTAVASISMRNSGSARAETPIQVFAGGSAEKRILLKQYPPLFRFRLIVHDVNPQSNNVF